MNGNVCAVHVTCLIFHKIYAYIYRKLVFKLSYQLGDRDNYSSWLCLIIFFLCHCDPLKSSLSAISYKLAESFFSTSTTKRNKWNIRQVGGFMALRSRQNVTIRNAQCPIVLVLFMHISLKKYNTVAAYPVGKSLFLDIFLRLRSQMRLLLT